MYFRYYLAFALWLGLGLFTINALSKVASANAGHRSTTDKVECSHPGNWLRGPEAESVTAKKVFDELSQRSFVLLGEEHDNAMHHRWQLHTLSALLGRSQRLVIGFEMFPRSVQSVLDQWVAGELSEKELLEKSDWRRVWGYDPKLYMPIFRFARMHRVPMVALNVDSKLVSRVARAGWPAIPIKDREGLSDPAPALSDYREALANVYRTKLSMMAKGRMASTNFGKNSGPLPSTAEVMEDPSFRRFVAAQLVWDRAMAQGLVEAKVKYPNALIVGVMGSGHLAYGHGVPHQLDQLGATRYAVLIPVLADRACEVAATRYSDLLFTVDPRANQAATRTRRLSLGVRLRDAKGAVLISQIRPGSVAEKTKLLKGDRVLEAAGVKITSAAELVDVVGRMTPGVWLPIIVERAGKPISLVAKFPSLTARAQ